jgi:hypothetical protein
VTTDLGRPRSATAWQSAVAGAGPVWSECQAAAYALGSAFAKNDPSRFSPEVVVPP